MQRHSSVLRNPTAVTDAVAQSKTIKEALGRLGLRAAGGNYRGLREACARFGIDVPRFNGPYHSNGFQAAPDAVIFCKNSRYHNRSGIKRRLLRRGVPERCAICGIGPEWNGKPLTLQLDHINGVFNDNRIANLRLLCPNCHSQTENYTGRNNGRGRASSKTACRYCFRLIHADAKRCGWCKRWLVTPRGREKIAWPPDDALLQLVRSTSMVAAGRALGVSDNAVRKRLRAKGLLAA